VCRGSGLRGRRSEVGDSEIRGHAEPPAVVSGLTAAVSGLTAVVEEPTAVVEEPTAVVERLTAVVEEPTAVVEEPTAVVEEPTAVVEEPTATVATEPKCSVNLEIALDTGRTAMPHAIPSGESYPKRRRRPSAFRIRTPASRVVLSSISDGAAQRSGI